MAGIDSPGRLAEEYEDRHNLHRSNLAGQLGLIAWRDGMIKQRLAFSGHRGKTSSFSSNAIYPPGILWTC